MLEGWSKKVKGPMDNSVVTTGGRDIREINGNGKNAIKKLGKKKNQQDINGECLREGRGA